MTIRQTLVNANKLLEKSSLTPYLDAQVLLGFILKQRKEYLLTYPERELTKTEQQRFNKLLQKRSKGVPIAYLVKKQAFYGEDFLVTPSVLIPRPETEQLIDLIIKIVPTLKKKQVMVADIGTGSGAIAITIKKQLGARVAVTATDISKRALAVAKKNSTTLKAAITFKHGNLLEPLKVLPDILVANLPYVPLTDKKIKSKLTSDLAFEPEKALYAANKGLQLFEDFFKQLANYKKLPQVVLLEMGHDQGPAVKAIAKEYIPWAKTKVLKDTCGKDRIALITL